MTDNELDYVGTTVALLTRHIYWRDQLWRTRPATKKKHKDDDAARVHNAFLALRLMNCGVYTTPVGCIWAHNIPKKSEEEMRKEVEEYYSNYNDIFDDYWAWQLEQR